MANQRFAAFEAGELSADDAWAVVRRTGRELGLEGAGPAFAEKWAALDAAGQARMRDAVDAWCAAALWEGVLWAGITA